MILTGFIVELETKSVPQGYHDCVVIAMPGDTRYLKIWVIYIFVLTVLLVVVNIYLLI